MSKVHWLAFATLPGVGSVTIGRLVEHFGSVEAAFNAPDDELGQIPRMTSETLTRLRAISLEQLEEEVTSLADEGITVSTWDDALYPANLRGLTDAPPLLFVQGELKD